MSANQKYLLLWPDLLLFRGLIDRALKAHQHHSIQLVIALEQAFLTKNLSTGEWESKQALLIPPNASHQCDAQNLPVLTLKFEPESAIGQALLTGLLHPNEVLDLSESKELEVLKERINNQLEKNDFAGIRAIVVQTLFDVFKLSNNKRELDPRIEQVRQYIQVHFGENLSTQDLMEVAHLSESRLLHLFKEQVGLPIRQYLQWERIRQAILHVVQGHDLTEAAYFAGFSDAAHFSRSFLARIGHPPSLVFKNSNSVQVFVAE
jgi:AraC-like DNA-binding protein